MIVIVKEAFTANPGDRLIIEDGFVAGVIPEREYLARKESLKNIMEEIIEITEKAKK